MAVAAALFLFFGFFVSRGNPHPFDHLVWGNDSMWGRLCPWALALLSSEQKKDVPFCIPRGRSTCHTQANRPLTCMKRANPFFFAVALTNRSRGKTIRLSGCRFVWGDFLAPWPRTSEFGLLKVKVMPSRQTSGDRVWDLKGRSEKTELASRIYKQ